jgi:hypothetical protein
MLIWLITGFIVYEAIQRIRKPEPVQGELMFFVALGGLGPPLTAPLTAYTLPSIRPPPRFTRLRNSRM